MRTAYFTFSAPDTAYYSALQTTTGAGSFMLNGTGAILSSVYTGLNPITTPGLFGRTISLTSTGNISGVNFTLTGYDILGNALSESVAGPNNNTVFSTNFFAILSGVAVDGAVGTNTSLGTGTTGRSQWFSMNKHSTPGNVGIQVTKTAGTISYTVQTTDYNMFSDTGVYPVAAPPAGRIVNSTDANLVAATATQVSTFTGMTSALGILINSSSGGGALIGSFTQAGIAQS